MAEPSRSKSLKYRLLCCWLALLSFAATSFGETVQANARETSALSHVISDALADRTHSKLQVSKQEALQWATGCVQSDVCDDSLPKLTLAANVFHKLDILEARLLVGLKMGDLFLTRARYTQALDLCARVAQQFRAVQAQKQHVYILLTALQCQAMSLYSINQNTVSLQKYKQALELAKEVGDVQFQSQLLCSIGKVLLQDGQFELAENTLRKSLSLASQSGGPLHDILEEVGTLRYIVSAGAEAHRTLGCSMMHRTAFEFHSNSSAIYNINDIFHMGKLADCFLTENQNSIAVQIFQKAMQMAEAKGAKDLEARFATRLTGTCARQVRHDQTYTKCVIRFGFKAKHLLEQIAEDLTSDFAQVTYTDSAYALVSRLLILALTMRDKHLQALAVLEDSQARAFENLLIKRSKYGVALLPNDNLLLLGHMALQSESSQHHLLPNSLSVLQMLDWACQNRVAMVLYSQASDNIILMWVISSVGSIVYFSAIDLSSIEAGEGTPLTHLVELARRQAGAAPRSNSIYHDGQWSDSDALRSPRVDEAAMELGEQQGNALKTCYAIFWSRFAAQLDEEARVVIVPDRDLFSLPFAALQNSNGDSLGGTHAIHISPSVGLLQKIKHRGGHEQYSSMSRLLVLAPGTFTWRFPNKQMLPTLNNSWREASAAEDVFLDSGWETKTLKAAQATSQALANLAVEADVIIIITHGTPDGKAFYLNGPTWEEGTVTMDAVYNMKLKARLVVLSACSTMKGEIRIDGIDGLARAFIAAGAQSVLASLFNILDGEAKAFMELVYKHFTENWDAADALCKAQAASIRNGLYQQVRNSFVVVGGDWYSHASCASRPRSKPSFSHVDVDATLGSAATTRGPKNNEDAKKSKRGPNDKRLTNLKKAAIDLRRRGMPWEQVEGHVRARAQKCFPDQVEERVRQAIGRAARHFGQADPSAEHSPEDDNDEAPDDEDTNSVDVASVMTYNSFEDSHMPHPPQYTSSTVAPDTAVPHLLEAYFSHQASEAMWGMPQALLPEYSTPASSSSDVQVPNHLTPWATSSANATYLNTLAPTDVVPWGFSEGSDSLFHTAPTGGLPLTDVSRLRASSVPEDWMDTCGEDWA